MEVAWVRRAACFPIYTILYSRCSVVYQLAFLTPGMFPSKACILKLYCTPLSV